MPLLDEKAAAGQWRQTGLNSGIVSTDDTQTKAGTPVQFCGVSLAWLERFAASIKSSFDLASSIHTTSDVVFKLIIPVSARLGARCR